MATIHAPKRNHPSLGTNAARITAIALSVGMAASVVAHFSGGDSDAPAAPMHQELTSAMLPSPIQSSVIISVPDTVLAAELASQFAQDDVAFGGDTKAADYAIGHASLNDRELNEINQIRAAFGEPPLVVLTVKRLIP